VSKGDGAASSSTTDWRGRSVLLLAAGAAAFHLFGAGFRPFTALVQRPTHLLFMALIGLLGVGVRKRAEAVERGAARTVAEGWTVALAVAALFACLYLVTQNEELVRRSGRATPLDLVAAGAALVLVLELARRATGWGLVTVCFGALAFAFAGPWLPGVLAHRGYGTRRILEHLYLSTEGIWGIPLGVSADFVYLFILFGAVLDVAGGGALLIALAQKVAGRSRGGPAKTAAVASAFMGSLSGSAVANVVTTGAFTIPLMRRAGFKPFFAGAIEAAASTGGQLVPPVMGAGAFILATWTNIPYRTVALAAAIPALLYYSALLAAIHFRAGRMGLEPSGEEEFTEVLRRLHLLVPLLIVVVLLAQGRSPMRAAFWGVISGTAMAFLRPETRPDRAQIQRALLQAAGGAVQVAAACAAAGVVVGVASLTGIGLRMSELIITASGGSLPVALALTALGSVVLGMGLPTTAAYVVLAALGAPALVEMGVPLLGAHLFIFYFGCISNVTPPVSLAAYAAAGISGAPPVRTAVTAAILATAGFAVPFLFVFEPALLLQGTWPEVVLASGTALVGLTGLAAGFMGYLRGPLSGLWRGAIMVGSLMVLAPVPWATLAGLAVLAGAVVFSRAPDPIDQAPAT
jgi:TRAP transporter 4TM/12TM fusion protein